VSPGPGRRPGQDHRPRVGRHLIHADEVQVARGVGRHHVPRGAGGRPEPAVLPPVGHQLAVRIVGGEQDPDLALPAGHVVVGDDEPVPGAHDEPGPAAVPCVDEDGAMDQPEEHLVPGQDLARHVGRDRRRHGQPRVARPPALHPGRRAVVRRVRPRRGGVPGGGARDDGPLAPRPLAGRRRGLQLAGLAAGHDDDQDDGPDEHDDGGGGEDTQPGPGHPPGGRARVGRERGRRGLVRGRSGPRPDGRRDRVRDEDRRRTRGRRHEGRGLLPDDRLHPLGDGDLDPLAADRALGLLTGVGVRDRVRGPAGRAGEPDGLGHPARAGGGRGRPAAPRKSKLD
jgi:hypothetical protein